MVSTISSRRLLTFVSKARSSLVKRTCGGIECSPVRVCVVADILICFWIPRDNSFWFCWCWLYENRLAYEWHQKSEEVFGCSES
jgi:hypothetical protein